MGRTGGAGTINVSLPVAEAVDSITAGPHATQGTAPQFFRMRNIRHYRECPTCASQISRRENGGAVALMGLANSVTGNTRVRGACDMSVAESGSGAKVNTILGYCISREQVRLSKGYGFWKVV